MDIHPNDTLERTRPDLISEDGLTEAPQDARRAEAATDKVGIFISHKAEDGHAAREVKRLLELYAAGRIEVFVSEEITPGDDWLEWIKERLLQSNLLLLLYTNPRASWDWCLFEAGLFTDLRGDDFRRVVALHHPDIDRPEPLSNLQTVEVSESSVKSFLKMFYGGTELIGVKRPINTALAADDNELSRQAKRIVSHIGTADFQPWFPLRRLVVSLDEPGHLQQLKDERTVPDDAPIEEVSSRTLADVFGLGQGNWTWSKLKEQARKRGDTAWLGELGIAAADAAEKQLDLKLVQTFRAAEGGLIYRPLLYRVDFVNDLASKVHLLFTEEKSPADVAGSGELARLFNMMRLAHRFRREVLESYKAKLRALSEDQGADVAFTRLGEVMTIIEKESAAMNLLDPSALQSPFDRDEDRARVLRLLEDWSNDIRTPLFAAIDSEDIEAVESHLEKLEMANREFLAICSRRYAELAKEEHEAVGQARTAGE